MNDREDTMRDTLTALMERQGAREQMLSAVLDKAMAGDMRAIEFIRDILGEQWKAQSELVHIELGEGVERLCR